MATGVTRMPISGSETPASHGPGADVAATAAPSFAIAAGLGNTRWPTTPATKAEAPNRADVIEPVPGMTRRCHRRGHGETAGEHRDDADHDLLGVGGTAAGPQAARRIKPPPRSSSRGTARGTARERPGRRESRSARAHRPLAARLNPAGAARRAPAAAPRTWSLQGSAAGDPPARRRLDGALAQRLPGADDDRVALGDESITYRGTCPGATGRSPARRADPPRRTGQPVVPPEHDRGIDDVAGCETPGEPGAELRPDVRLDETEILGDFGLGGDASPSAAASARTLALDLSPPSGKTAHCN